MTGTDYSKLATADPSLRAEDVTDRSWVDELRRLERLPREYERTLDDIVVPLATRIVNLRDRHASGVVVGICGAQGSGKSTFALFLENWLQREHGLTAVTLSLDDLYLGKQARLDLARTQHPLLQTRGVPGTHDVALGIDILEKLTAGEGDVLLPSFDKATDDRIASSKSRSFAAPVDVVLFEGWCVGARPQSDEQLREPVNQFEAAEDADESWRRYVNDRLKGDYAELFGRLDALVLLMVPSFAKVREWRGLQEQKLVGTVDKREIERFIRYFERLTRHIQASMPGYASALIEIDDKHRMASLDDQGWPH